MKIQMYYLFFIERGSDHCAVWKNNAVFSLHIKRKRQADSQHSEKLDGVINFIWELLSSSSFRWGYPHLMAVIDCSRNTQVVDMSRSQLYSSSSACHRLNCSLHWERGWDAS
jgi:hypothetical protein